MLARPLAASLLLAASVVAQVATFGSPVILSIGENPRQISGGDVDGDGTADLVTTLFDGSLAVTCSLEFWTPDPAAVKGWSASNALRATLP